jgi:proline iminopeptidase
MMPQEVQARLTTLEQEGQIGGSEYQDLITKYFYSHYICRLDPWPIPLQRSFAGINSDIHETMQGPNEFTPIGNLKGWDRWKDLASIHTPTLVMGARYDEMNRTPKANGAKRSSFLRPNCSSVTEVVTWRCGTIKKPIFAALLSFLSRHRE